MPASQPASFNLQEFTDNGQLLVGGRLYTYAYGTTVQKTAFTDPDATVPHTYTLDGSGGQYIALNARGELPAPLYLVDGHYDLSLKRADGSTVWTRQADGVENSILSMFVASIGASLIGFVQACVGAIIRKVQDKLRERITPEDFGAVGDGVADDTAALTLAFAWAMSHGGRLEGVSGSTYLVTSKISLNVNGHFSFDGNDCVIKNGISNAVAADPIFEITNVAVDEVYFGNFRVIGGGTNGHVVALMGNPPASGPQMITLHRISTAGTYGNGKDYTGAAMPAQLVYAHGGMTLKVLECISYQAGGIYFDSVLKVHISDTTVDSPITGRCIYMTDCNDVLIDGNCTIQGLVADLVEVVNCNLVTITGNRFKLGPKRYLYAHGSASVGISFTHNQIEVYTFTDNVVEITTAVKGVYVAYNSFKFIHAADPSFFTKGAIAIVDEPGGGYILSCPVVEGNSFIMSNAMTIAYLIKLSSLTNSVRAARVISNTLVLGAAGSTVTTGILLEGNIVGTSIEQNRVGAEPGNTMTTGILVGANCTGARLIENYYYGSVTTPVSDLGIRTTRIENGAFVDTTFAPTVAGSTAAGGGNYTSQTGFYSRNADLVRFDMHVVWNSHTGTGNMTFPLPFTCATRPQVVQVAVEGFAFAGVLRGFIPSGSNVLQLLSETSGASLAAVPMTASGDVFISGYVKTL